MGSGIALFWISQIYSLSALELRSPQTMFDWAVQVQSTRNIHISAEIQLNKPFWLQSAKQECLCSSYGFEVS